MPQLNIGDTVRFLNTTGGGTVTRLKDNLAYVTDDDGFETPVLIKECVVVARPSAAAPAASAPSQPQAAKAAPAAPTRAETAPAALPAVEETPEGEKLNITIGFEASDLKRLSSASFDAFLVNDSNYWLHYTVATRGRHDTEWTLRAAATVEPSTQEFMFELGADDLPDFDRILFQAVAFKRGKDFAAKPVINFEHKVDSTRFARLHCFRPNPYFDEPVIALDIVADDVSARRDETPAPEELRRAMMEKSRAETPAQPKPHRKSQPGQSILEVDLHATELLETTAGMSAAEILNYQIDYFRRIMDENLRFPGRKIVFIHGNGEGVLRQALQKELNYRYKGHDVADASFREYGFGATMVTIRRLKK